MLRIGSGKRLGEMASLFDSDSNSIRLIIYRYVNATLDRMGNMTHYMMVIPND